MSKRWNREELKAMPIHERAELYKNACRLGHTPQGAAVKKLIEEAGLPYSDDACLTSDDPITIKMHDIIHSKQGREAAIAATQRGVPAMEGIDPLLQAALGVDYGAHNKGTATAGGLVGELMYSLGYKKKGVKTLPAHCVARTASVFA